MKSVIYVFSGTGNSLAVARTIAKGINAKVIVIRDKVKASIPANGTAGIVFPVYAWGYPKIVGRFLKNFKAKNNSYIFSVANCADSSGAANSMVKKSLKKNGIELAAGFTVKMPSNYIVFSGAESQKKQQAKFSKTNLKIKQIISAVNKRESIKPETGGLISYVLGTLVYPMFASHINASDKKFSVDDKCNGCSTCAKICPVKNITMVKKHPSWHHKCEQCLACLQWCPRSAIQFGRFSRNKKRYHHPDIRLKDMM